MELVYFYQYFGTPKGGWSTRVYELCKRWVREGHKVTVVTSPYDKSDIPVGKGLWSKYNYEGIDVIVINLLQSNKHSFAKRLYTFLMFSLVSIYFSLKLKCDLVIASSGPITIGLPGLFAKWFRGKKMIFEVRDLWPEGAIQLGILKNRFFQKIAYAFEALCYKNASLIVACSEGMKASIVERFPKAKSIVITNASDVALFQEQVEYIFPEWAEGKKIFVYTGSLGVMDNCKQIINAAIECQKRNYNDVLFVIIGDGVERPMLQKVATDNNLSNVHFLGLIPKMQVVAWLQKAYAAMVCFKNIPVLNTCSPNKLFDAFAAGVPVIQTTQGWIKDTLEREDAGVTVFPNNEGSFADAIHLMTTNESLRNKMAENAKRLGSTEFNRDKLAAIYLDELKKVYEK